MRKVKMGSLVLGVVIASVLSTAAFADGDVPGKRPQIQIG